jgi:hypothetical protein
LDNGEHGREQTDNGNHHAGSRTATVTTVIITGSRRTTVSMADNRPKKVSMAGSRLTKVSMAGSRQTKVSMAGRRLTRVTIAGSRPTKIMYAVFFKCPFLQAITQSGKSSIWYKYKLKFAF